MKKVDPIKQEERRREILEAAARCFGRNGFQGVSVASICAEAGMSGGHLYHYFASKEAIIEAMVDAHLERAAARFGEVASGVSVMSALVAQLALGAGDRGCHDAPLLFDMFAEAGRNPTMAGILKEHSRRMLTLLIDLLRDGQGRGEIDPTIDPEQVAPVLISIIDGSKTLALRSPNLKPEAYVELVWTLMTRFLVPPGCASAE